MLANVLIPTFFVVLLAWRVGIMANDAEREGDARSCRRLKLTMRILYVASPLVLVGLFGVELLGP